jgi:lipooligosaccharide transport system ATP-binding protein
LTKRYGAAVAVDGIDFDVEQGSCFGFLGPNGAGKTSTMKMITCASPISEGQLSVFGLDAAANPREVKRRMGVVHQGMTLDEALDVRDNLVVFARFFDVPWAVAVRRAGELLAFTELGGRERDAVASLSGGMQRRLMIARALMSEPELLILDEPTTGLDPQARHAVWERLRQLKRRGVTQILTTHYMDEAAQLCDRLLIIDHGRVVAQGAPAALIEEHVGREVVEIQAIDEDGAADRVAAAAAPMVDSFEIAGDRVYLHTLDGEALMREIRATHAPVSAMMVRRATLEDVFLRLTGRTLRD